MFLLALAGLLTGLIVSAPMGPMAALAGFRLADNHRAAALMIAAGGCVGDTILACVALAVLNLPTMFVVPEWLPVTLAASILAFMAVMVWMGADKDVTPAQDMRGFGGALLVTLTYPGNVVAYLGLYAALLPAMAGDTPKISWLGMAVLLVTTSCGLVLGWTAFFKLVDYLRRKYGKLPKRMRPMMAKGISVFMAMSALVILFLYWTKRS